MSLKSHNSQRALVLVAVALLVSSMLPPSIAGKVTYVPQTMLSMALTPITAIFHGLSLSVRPQKKLDVPNISSFDQLQAEYSEATFYIRRLEIENQQLRMENQLLRNAPSSNQGAEGITLVKARTTSTSNDKINPSITISKGQNQGLSAGNVAIYAGNLIGVIHQISPLTAEVRLINSQSVQLPVIVSSHNESDAARLSKEYLLERNPDDNYQTFYASIEVEAPVQIGDWAHLSDQRNIYWPSEAKGAIVGQVIEIIPDPNKPFLLNRMIIQPRIELSRLREVDIVIPQQGY
ncbi:Cell shape-determining protein MreC [Poriferisphaera corsica]|uniref:Cell shape-determining protein MreC n=1 Tax=Poriferisphaera corsica TaxID=2528020 RepID=A0A517YSU2_9BACT|nr:rod shape-determining protein MreC [Poriferisphaera corsica]QDU33222.1 Cell shape-determining protein MreC [Poriferisphaera corsica]